jgi:ribosomal protein S18 acetylase RimI-like enzyme
MKKTHGSKTAGVELRRLAAGDFERAVAIDAAILGRRRRAYFERRLQSALKAPEDHVQFAAARDGELAGYALGRRMLGEFGRAEPALRLETIGVSPGQQGHGIGMRLLGELEAWALKHGIRQIRTSADWRHHLMLRFFDRAGFELGRNHVIDCAVHGGQILEGEDAKVLAPGHHRATEETDYSAPTANDFETLARDRSDVRSLAPGDLADIVRIDHRITGRDRADYIARLVNEAMRDSAIRVSLAAHRDGSVAGFVMAKVDIGDFGRMEPVAVIDTIGVDPGFAAAGIGTALLSQLFVNLEALHVERVETVVSRENFELLGFFYRAGFGPSRRLAFVKGIAQKKAS